MDWKKEFEEYQDKLQIEWNDNPDDFHVSWEEEIEWKDNKLNEMQDTIHSLLRDKEYLLRIIRNIKYRIEENAKSFKFDTEGYSDFKHIKI